MQDVFPADFYAALQAMLPDPKAMLPIAQVRPVDYSDRFVLELSTGQVDALPPAQRDFWTQLNKALVGGRFGHLVISKFQPFVEHRFGRNPDLQLYDEAMLVEDVTNYKLGPHTDARRKVITFLFYLPPDDSQQHLGTSMYVPKDPGLRCPGGPHHPREKFDRVWTMPFLPNSLFAFFKTDTSFHGVEPVMDPDTRRWLLLYDIYVNEEQLDRMEQPAKRTAEVKFAF